ncbi:MAG: hypothetical protein ACO1NX_06295 [Chitinophagaceae bacterium]
MKLSEFILLDEKQKSWTVLHDGILIGKRSKTDQMVFLFQLHNYYVETYCNTANKEVEEFRVFGGTAPLSPYLDSISIDDLLN